MDICPEASENCFVHACRVKLSCTCCGEGWLTKTGADMIETSLLYTFVMPLSDSTQASPSLCGNSQSKPHRMKYQVT